MSVDWKQKAADLEAVLVSHFDPEAGRLAALIGAVDEKIKRGPERVAAGIRGVEAGEVTTRRHLERDRKELEAKVEALRVDRQKVEDELAEVTAFLGHREEVS